MARFSLAHAWQRLILPNSSKLLIAHNVNVLMGEANLFALQKDALVIESQLVVYSNREIVDSFFDFKNLIINTPHSEFLRKWGEIYQKGGEYLVLCRKHLGVDISENFETFIQKLVTEAAVDLKPNITISANTMGSITQQSPK